VWDRVSDPVMPRSGRILAYPEFLSGRSLRLQPNHLERLPLQAKLNRSSTHILPIGINIECTLALHPHTTSLKILNLWKLQMSAAINAGK
jgi:hypothetical protein